MEASRVRIQFSYRERIAGLFLLFGVLGVIAFTIGAAIQNRWLEPRITFHALIVRGEGLHQGSAVLLSGIEVGEVGNMTILADNRIDMEILVRERHAHRVKRGVRCVIKRLLGIGEKRVYLVSDERTGEALPPGALLPSNEPTDLLDAVSNIDLNYYIKTMDRAVAALEITLGKLEEENRLARMMEAFDHIGPTMQRMNNFLDQVDDPLIEFLEDPSLRRTFKGADKIFNDPNTRKAMQSMASTFAPEKIDGLIEKTDKLIARLNTVLVAGGHFDGAVKGMDRLTNDKRVDRMLTAMEKVTDEKKLEKLVDNMSIVAHQMARIGPQIPTLTQEMISTLKEMIIVFKALQKTWLLDEESAEAQKEIRRKR